MVKKGFLRFFIFISFICFCFNVSAIPFIVGQVSDAFDGTSANGRTVVLWNSDFGMNDNVTDVIGPTGNSGANNIYLIDCALLNNSCEVGMNISVKVLGTNGRITNTTNLTITGAGFQQVAGLRLNSPFSLNYTFVDDLVINPAGEIDLIAGDVTPVFCQGVVYDLDGEYEIKNASSTFFDNALSYSGDLSDNNVHYVNTSCLLDYSYGTSKEAYFTCLYEVYYYANNNLWNCSVFFNEIWDYSITSFNTTLINPLLAIQLPDFVDFGETSSLNVSIEKVINVTNFGNVMINLSLEGYARTLGDNLSMNCSDVGSDDIPIGYQKFNLTSSNPGNLDLNQFESLYSNLTSSRIIRAFNLNYRRNDTWQYLDDTNATYWRVYPPLGVSGTCNGNIIFGAERSEGI